MPAHRSRDGGRAAGGGRCGLRRPVHQHHAQGRRRGRGGGRHPAAAHRRHHGRGGEQRRRTAVGLLGTGFTMAQPFYADRLTSHGLDVARPVARTTRPTVHRIIYDELCLGVVRDESRERLPRRSSAASSTRAPRASSTAAPRSSCWSARRQRRAGLPHHPPARRGRRRPRPRGRAVLTQGSGAATLQVINGGSDGQGSLRALRRSCRRVPDVVRARRHPHDRALLRRPDDADPAGDRLQARAAAGQRLRRARAAAVPRGAGPHAGRHLGQGRRRTRSSSASCPTPRSSSPSRSGPPT